METLYTAESLSTGQGREGRVQTPDGKLDLALASPAELGGSGAGTNPEQLFAAGYAACFESALRLVARRKDIELGDVAVTAEVAIGKDGNGFALAAKLRGRLPGMERRAAEELMREAHEVCPYSKATRGHLPVELLVEG